MNKRGRPRYPDVLTPRQWEVLALLREGLSNDQIAQRLGISLDGVKFHVSEILGKLAVTSRNEAARWRPVERTTAPSASLRHSAHACLRSAWSRDNHSPQVGAQPVAPISVRVTIDHARRHLWSRRRHSSSHRLRHHLAAAV